MLGPYDLTDAIFNHKDVRKLLLMQYTGLKDIHGKEIYEGDILHYCLEEGGAYSLSEIDVVEFTNGMFVASYPITQCVRREIIGNIYEHPELLTPSTNNQ